MIDLINFNMPLGTLIQLVELGVVIFLLVVVTSRWVGGVSSKWKGRYFRKNHVIVIGVSRVSMQVSDQLLAQGRKVSVIYTGTTSPDIELLRKKGALVLHAAKIEADVLVKAGLSHASNCMVATGSDEDNLAIVEFLKDLKRTNFPKQRLRILVQVQGPYTGDLMKDYLPPAERQGGAEVQSFNEKRLAAQLVYDLNPPYSLLRGEARLRNEESICIVGYNETAKYFLIENAILSQYPGDKRLKIFLVTNDARDRMTRLRFELPYIDQFLDIVPVEMENESFMPSQDWDTSFIKALTTVDAVYCFGDDDPRLFTMALHLRQFLYNHTQQLRNIPITLCMPETNSISALMRHSNTQNKSSAINMQELNLHLVHAISDTCTVKKLIDERELSNQLAKVVNYFYSVKYEFEELLKTEFRQSNSFKMLKDLQEKMIAYRSKTPDPLAELENLVIDAIASHTKNSKYRVKKYFGINERWDALTERKKDSNRYVVRHMSNKLHYLRVNGITDISPASLEKQFHVLAPLEHKRWSAEKYASGFVSGALPGDKVLKSLLKDTLKIHDQLTDFSKLQPEEQKKDMNLFHLLPLLVSVQKQLTPQPDGK